MKHARARSNPCHVIRRIRGIKGQNGTPNDFGHTAIFAISGSVPMAIGSLGAIAAITITRHRRRQFRK